MDSENNEIYIAMAGSGGVGKTCLSLMFVRGEFMPSYVPTIEDEFQKNVNIDGTTYQAFIVDTAGQEEFKDIKCSAFRRCDGFCLVYAVDEETSVQELKENYDLISSVKPNPKVIILANKCDLPKPWKNDTEKVKQLVSSWGPQIPVIETSAKEGIGVNEAFERIARKMTGKDQSKGKGKEEQGGGCCSIQ